MIVENLDSSLRPHLRNAKAIYVAVALMNGYGLNAIETSVPETCERNYIVGTDLPTHPKVLEDLLKKKENGSGIISSKVYNNNRTYHPKVYIVRNAEDDLIAFIGSGNATQGGFFKNVEMGFFVTDSVECQKLLDWFMVLQKNGQDFDQKYIDEYSIAFKKNRALSATQKSNTDKVNGKAQPNLGGNIIVSPGQFFRQSDFDAFGPARHLLTDGATVDSRAEVKWRLKELDQRIFPRFKEFEIDDLHHHPRTANRTSYHWHTNRTADSPLDAIWLHYGKSEIELSQFDNKKFVDHLRIQIILRNNDDEAYIGIWLFLGMPNKGILDRKNIKDSLESLDFISRLYEYLLSLGDSYWIAIGQLRKWISNIESKSQLREFLSRDHYSGGFIIGRNYPPDHPDLSEENIEETTLIEFSKLYKVYDLIKDRPNNIISE